jgi:hypothetical protein
MRAAAVTVCCALLVAAAFAAGIMEQAGSSIELGCDHACKKFHEKKIPGCDLKGDGCKCIFHHRYKVKFTDPMTGETGESGWTHKDKAGDEAIYSLFAKDRGCNCHTNHSLPLGNCTMSLKACFFFQNFEDVAGGKTAFQLYGALETPVKSQEYTDVAANQTMIKDAAFEVLAKILEHYPQCKPSHDNLESLGAFAITAAGRN